MIHHYVKESRETCYGEPRFTSDNQDFMVCPKCGTEFASVKYQTIIYEAFAKGDWNDLFEDMDENQRYAALDKELTSRIDCLDDLCADVTDLSLEIPPSWAEPDRTPKQIAMDHVQELLSDVANGRHTQMSSISDILIDVLKNIEDIPDEDI